MSTTALSWTLSVGGAGAVGLAFLLATLVTGDYDWVARLGGAGWVFLLALIILLPTVMPAVRERETRRVSADVGSGAGLREEVSVMVKDPVCGMEIDPATAAGSSEYQGETYHFCNLNCKKSFDEDPERYVSV